MRSSPSNVAARDQAFEPRTIPTLVWTPERHHVVVWLFKNRYWRFEFTSLRHAVCARRFPRRSSEEDNKIDRANYCLHLLSKLLSKGSVI
jgi:hypothetical protein